MSTEQKKFIRTILIIVISALVGQIIVGFGILNRDHFTIKSNNEKILEINKKMEQKLSYDAFNQFMRYKEAEVELLMKLVNEYKNDNKEVIKDLESEIKENKKRIDQLFIEFGIGSIRGDEFKLDVIPEIFKEDS